MKTRVSFYLDTAKYVYGAHVFVRNKKDFLRDIFSAADLKHTWTEVFKLITFVVVRKGEIL